MDQDEVYSKGMEWDILLQSGGQSGGEVNGDLGSPFVTSKDVQVT